MARIKRIQIGDKELSRWKKFVRGLFRVLIHFLVWSGIAVIYYFVFAFFFDTPAEFHQRSSTAKLNHEYRLLNERYDSLVEVLDNVSERDRNVFQVLFESDPYDFDDIARSDGWVSYERLMSKSNRELAAEFLDKNNRYANSVNHLYRTYTRVQDKLTQLGDKVNNIPSIQPVVNNELTLLTASYGLRIHPFYRSLMPHGGVDYTVPEGTRVFATADGTIKEVSSRNTGSGLTLVINHGNGYETMYSHLSHSKLLKGDRVKRGDIIARTGNTGLSFSAHLHYEIRKDGMRIDPIHYFFMELTPKNYQRIIRIAQSGMQSFD